jgi:hypothetical protein
MNKLYPRLLGVAFFAVPFLPLAIAQEKQNVADDKDALKKFLKSFSEPIRIAESKPVTVNDAEFVVVAQTNWKPPKTDKFFPMVAPIEIQLRITNLGKNDAIFPTFQTFGVKITDAGGTEVKPRNIRVGDFSTRPVLLAKGLSHWLCPRAELRWDEKAKASELVFFDGTGSESVFSPLPAGRFKLSFWYSAAADKKAKQKMGEPFAWVGEAATREVFIEVGDSPTRGSITGPDRLTADFADPLQVIESKPVVVNDAKFVLATQAQWRPKKSGVVPIDMQLRITNLGKNGILFPTFDSFGLALFDADGKRLMDRGGRDLTIITRPIFLPQGTSYALGAGGILLSRRAELRWDGKRNVTELMFGDGTGWQSVIGPLESGRYKLVFSYSISKQAKRGTETDDSGTWHGTSRTVMFVKVLGH